MVSLSPLWASSNGAFQITICSGFTFKTITIDENGKQLPDLPKMKMQKCAMCMAAGMSALLAEDYFVPNFEPLANSRADVKFISQVLKPSIRSYAPQSRAPPFLS